MSESILADYLSEADLARELGITLRSLRRWRLEPGFCAHVRIGRRRYYHRDDVRDWLAARKRGGNPRRQR